METMTPVSLPGTIVTQAPGGGPGADPADWLRQTLYKIHLDLHTPEWHESILRDLDPHQIIRNITRAGACCIYFFAKDCYGNAYYNTRVGHKHLCIGERDLLREILETAHEARVRVMAYYSVIWDNRMAEEHPEWCMRGVDGAPLTDSITQAGGKWKYVCHNSGYADYLRAMLREIATDYPVDGFHLDMLNMDFGRLSCYCDTCRALFRQQTGWELPTEPAATPQWRAFLEFRYHSVERIGNLMRDTIREISPGLPVVMNYHGAPDLDWRVGQMPVRHSLFSSLSTGETYTPMFGDMYPGLESRFVRDLVPGKPCELASWRMNRGTDFTVKPAAQLKWELMTSLANGVNTMLIDQTFANGWLDEVTYDCLGEVFKEIDAKVDYWGGEPVPHVALYYSCKTRDLYGLTNQKKCLLPVMGAYKAMIESHFNVAFLFDETLTLERLKRFPVVFLPNVAVMSRHECDVFSQYVAEGGALVATFDTSRYAETGERIEDFQLAELFGVQYVATNDYNEHYLRNLPGEFGRDLHPGYHMLNIGAYHRVRATTAQGLGDLYCPFFKRQMPDRFFSHNMHPPYLRETDSIYCNQYGKGKVIYLPHGLDGSFADQYEIPQHRTLMRNIVRSLGEEPLASIQAPFNVETTVMRKNGRTLIHLLQFSPVRRSVSLPSLDQCISPSGRMEEPAIYRATVRLKMPFKSVRAFDPRTRLTIQDQVVEIMCEDVHEVLIVE